MLSCSIVLLALPWIQSEPPRGSGWVRRRLHPKNAALAPTRYREVVLTVSKHISFNSVALGLHRGRGAQTLCVVAVHGFRLRVVVEPMCLRVGFENQETSVAGGGGRAVIR